MLKALIGARSMLTGLRVEFLDIRVTVGPDKQLATAHLTARARLPGDSNNYVQELKVILKKIGGSWLIIEAEGVKTLSFHRRDQRQLS